MPARKAAPAKNTVKPDGLRLRLVVPGNVRHNSGGNVYNAALARELAALGVEVDICPLDGGWPVGSPEDRRRLATLLCDGDSGGASEHDAGDDDDAGADAASGAAMRRVTLVDGLLACGAPEELAAAAAAGRPAWILLHMPLDDTGHGEAALERRALRAAAGVICTSTSAAAGIRARHGLDGVTTALPGSDAAALAAGSEPPHFLAVAALLPNKDQSLLLAALSALTDLPWTASLVGSDAADPAYAARLRDTVDRLGLQDRIRIPGELRGGALEAEWSAADLSLLISQAETFGLVVTESIARGVPVVVRAGTGAVEALAAGTPAPAAPATLTAAPGAPAQPTPAPSPAAADSAALLPGTAVALGTDPAPLTEVLRRWLSEPGLRTRWRGAAVAARDRLPGWDATARTVLAAIAPERPGSERHGSNHPAPELPADRQRAAPQEKPDAEDSPAAQAGGQ
ncbi:glycosyltransferase involved in cell wall biosynthesis [Pseudarthrobacter oxydans]|uniref:glycosyltransferase n=1 Tax=Pseudarthrobacter oxydans TaxID=1671 RepID=UPI002783E568|nr:glycosyltransferase [Pseudarthrobacter oxydans]MDP9982762.1 glycosyltransferase involved in cell wall biosynthesis [Pseudarthrobacter oxydans]